MIGSLGLQARSIVPDCAGDDQLRPKRRAFSDESGAPSGKRPLGAPFKRLLPALASAYLKEGLDQN